MSDFQVILVGAGHNGLVCATYLAKAGLKVLLLEKNNKPGGPVVTDELFPGCLFSTYAFFCYLLHPKVISDLELRKYGFSVINVDPYRFHPFPDKTYLILWSDVEKTQKEFLKYSRLDSQNYPLWLDFWYRSVKLFQPYIFKPGCSLNDIRANLSLEDDLKLFDFIAQKSMSDLVNQYFTHEKVKTTFVHSQDVGDPSLPGSLLANMYYRFSMLNNSEDIGILRGGAGSLTQALVNSAKAAGVEIRLSSEVKKVLVKDQKVFGVRLLNDAKITADKVISNLDPKSTFLNLFDSYDLNIKFINKVRNLKTEVSYGKFHAVLKKLPDASQYFGTKYDPRKLGMIKLCPNIAAYKKSWIEAQQGKFPSAPIMDINIASVYDSALACSEKHTISIWLSFFPVGKQLTSSQRWSYVRRAILSQLESYFPGFCNIVEDWLLITPQDMEDSLGLFGGNIRHLDMVPPQMFNLRPTKDFSNYITSIKNFYLCGSGTYPGGEISGIPGYNCAEKVIQDSLLGGE